MAQLNWLKWFTKPKNLLLMDCLGAIATALATGTLLTTIIPTGLPMSILWSLSMTAGAFACFDFCAYRYVPNAYWPLATIGILNLLYCLAAVFVCIAYLPRLTMVALIYFSLESALVIPLAFFELAVARSGWLDRKSPM